MVITCAFCQLLSSASGGLQHGVPRPFDTMVSGLLSAVLGGWHGEGLGGLQTAVLVESLSMGGGSLGAVSGESLDNVSGDLVDAKLSGSLSAVPGGLLGAVLGDSLKDASGGLLGAAFGRSLHAVLGGSLNAVLGGSLRQRARPPLRRPI